MPITIKCSNCKVVISFERYFTTPIRCPNCKKDWDRETKINKFKNKEN